MVKLLFIAMSSVRWCGTVDVANPRPREVGGACRRQVLAGARTQETVGGPNGAQRSELRRTASPDNNDIVTGKCFPAMSWIFVAGHACMTFTIPQGHLRGNVAWPPVKFYSHLAGANSLRRDDATAPSVTH